MKKTYYFLTAFTALSLTTGFAQAEIKTTPIVGGAVIETTGVVTIKPTTTTTTKTETTVEVKVDLGANTNSISPPEDTPATDSETATKTLINTSSDTEVSVTYERPTKLFGFIPTTIEEKATVEMNAFGKAVVDVDRSWWSIFTTSDTRSSEFEDAIKSRVENQDIAITGESRISILTKTNLISQIEASYIVTYGAK
jgi:hypothetical protein